MHTRIHIVVALLSLVLATGVIVVSALNTGSVAEEVEYTQTEQPITQTPSLGNEYTEARATSEMTTNMQDVVQETGIQSEECNYQQLQEEAGMIISETAFDTEHWTQTATAFEEEPYQYGWISGTGTSVVPCSYTITYSSQKVDQFNDDLLMYQLRSVLKEMGWGDEPALTFVSDSTGTSITIALAHAGGPGSNSIIFTRPSYQEQEVQFARVSELNLSTNRPAFLDGEVDSPCPC